MRFLLILSFLLAACSPQVKTEPIPQGAMVLVLGDSLAFGTGAGEGKSYPALLATKTGWNVVNAGIPGDTTAGGLARLPELLSEEEPKLVIVELGGNDFLRRIPRQDTESNLMKIVEECRSRKIPAILVAVPGPSIVGAAFHALSDDPVYEEVSKKTGAPLVSGVISKVLSDPELRSDQIHANEEGYREIADGIATSLSELGYF